MYFFFFWNLKSTNKYGFNLHRFVTANCVMRVIFFITFVINIVTYAGFA
jgi:hypothetical protein